MNYYELGQRIRKIRKAKEISQELLAEKIDISVTHMSHIETGNTKLSLPVLVKITKALDISSDYLIFGSNKEADADTDQISAILRNCTPEQKTVITDTVIALKAALDKNI